MPVHPRAAQHVEQAEDGKQQPCQIHRVIEGNHKAVHSNRPLRADQKPFRQEAVCSNNLPQKPTFFKHRLLFLLPVFGLFSAALKFIRINRQILIAR